MDESNIFDGCGAVIGIGLGIVLLPIAIVIALAITAILIAISPILIVMYILGHIGSDPTDSGY